ncbi:SUMF1/EgtB/PvdO family nonheme iron enzyme [Dongia sp.]|uniref:SUMF1/EgtB/PvdO family nonheme iron enzyme n=1 Tax=Dongia sp. TaxID=1977262 RepID=UPI0035B244A3
MPAATAEPRLALVIGNSTYGGEMGKLPNPANDAALMAATLAKLGFKVTKLIDADQKQMKRAIADFGSALTAAGPDAAGLFFYAGHGVQIAGENYLIPLRAEIGKEADAELEAVPADWVLKQMEFAGNRINIIILDACRNNPLPRSVRSVDRGLARMDAPKGSFIAYATAPGETAADGAGKNSPYTQALAKAMQQPGISIEETFRNARVDVLKQTAEKQIPWESSSLTGAFYFQERGAAASVAPDTGAELPTTTAAVQPPPSGAAAGKIIRDCPSCPELVTMAPGNFVMGARNGERGATEAEFPQTPITVAPFAIGKSEVTRGEFGAFVEAAGYEPARRCWAETPAGKFDFVDGRNWRNPGYKQSDRDPVVCISADDALAYVKWLAATTGRAYRLPSEAEWEYAARGGTQTPTPWGDDTDAICANGNIADSAAAAHFKGWRSVDCDDGYVFTAPAGSFAANAFGLFDMLGNVKEWVADCWNDDLDGIGPSAKPRRAGNCDMRAVRGSAWDGLPDHNRSAYREGNNRPTAYFNYGFRVARDL